MTWIALGRALSGILRPRLLLAFWLLQVLVALVVAVPYAKTVEGAFGRQPDTQARAERLDEPWLGDFRRARAPALDALGHAAGAAIWVHLVLANVLAGGVLGAFDRRAAERRHDEGTRWTYAVFLADAGRWAWPMLRLFALSLPLFYLVDLAVNEGLGKLVDDWLGDRSTERVLVLGDWWRQGVLLVLLWIVATWFDLARARVVVDRRRSALVALSSAGGTILRHPGPVVAVSGLLVLLELALMAAATALLAGVATSSWEALALWLVATQVLVLLRIGLGFGRLAGFVAIAEEERADRETAAPA